MLKIALRGRRHIVVRSNWLRAGSSLQQTRVQFFFYLSILSEYQILCYRDFMVSGWILQF